MNLIHFILSILFLITVFSYNCTDTPTFHDRNIGEVCIKTAHCLEGLICHNGVCVPAQDAGSGDISHDLETIDHEFKDN